MAGAICSGENEAAAETAAASPWSSSPPPSIYSARRLRSQYAVNTVWLRVLASTGLRWPHHHWVHDVRQTATSQCQDQGPDAAVRSPASLHRLRCGWRQETSASRRPRGAFMFTQHSTFFRVILQISCATYCLSWLVSPYLDIFVAIRTNAQAVGTRLLVTFCRWESLISSFLENTAALLWKGINLSISVKSEPQGHRYIYIGAPRPGNNFGGTQQHFAPWYFGPHIMQFSSPGARPHFKSIQKFMKTTFEPWPKRGSSPKWPIMCWVGR